MVAGQACVTINIDTSSPSNAWYCKRDVGSQAGGTHRRTGAQAYTCVQCMRTVHAWALVRQSGSNWAEAPSLLPSYTASNQRMQCQHARVSTGQHARVRNNTAQMYHTQRPLVTTCLRTRLRTVPASSLLLLGPVLSSGSSNQQNVGYSLHSSIVFGFFSSASLERIFLSLRHSVCSRGGGGRVAGVRADMVTYGRVAKGITSAVCHAAGIEMARVCSCHANHQISTASTRALRT